jgi:transcription elongation factor Elf1
MVPPENDDPVLSLTCPECEHAHARVFVRSLTILTVKCGHCHHSWSTLIAMLPEPVLKQLPPH